MNLDWNKITDNKKLELKNTKYVFIAGSIDLSESRILKLKKVFGNKMLWGIFKDEYILGLENSLQFKTLSLIKLKNVIKDKFNYIEFYQRDLKFILKEIDFSLVIFVNGSWHKMIHTKEEFWNVVNKKIPYRFLSPFTTENEAKDFSLKIEQNFKTEFKNKTYTDLELINLANIESKKSFDWTFQVGAILAKNQKVLLTSFNKVVPYQSYAMHFGSAREQNFCASGDLNFYNTIHAEASLIINAGKQRINLLGTKLIIPLLPCPTCAKLIAESDISEVVYSIDHSNGYAIKLLEQYNKKVTRIVI